MDGILCLDKPVNITSFLCCAIVRRLLCEKKAGHAGTLDPMATGVLPVFLGKATRAIPLLPTHQKRYTATLQFGLISDTLDIWGTVRETGVAPPPLSAIEEALSSFRGDILQVPPMTSALKKDGVRLYELARRGIEIDRPARPVTIHELTLLHYQADSGTLELDCLCSKGTYIRTLCDDLGQKLGCGAVMTGLRRTMAAGYCLSDSLPLEDAKRLAQKEELSGHVLPVESAFARYPVLSVTPAQAVRFGNGGGLSLNRLAEQVTTTVRVRDPDGRFLGLGKPEKDELKVLKVFI